MRKEFWVRVLKITSWIQRKAIDLHLWVAHKAFEELKGN